MTKGQKSQQIIMGLGIHEIDLPVLDLWKYCKGR